MKMKKIIISLLLLGMGVIIYFFIKEQFNGITLTTGENRFLAFTYLANGILILLFARIKRREKSETERPVK